MKTYKAIFFDRDDTLTHDDPKTVKMRQAELIHLTGYTYPQIHETGKVVSKSTFEKMSPIKTIDEENRFWLAYYADTLQMLGVSNPHEEARRLIKKYVYYNHLKPYSETIDVLKHFISRGCKIGVISNTFPSLKLSLQNAGIAQYIDSFTASVVAGVSKPEPAIYEKALRSLNVSAQESMFVDDIEQNADGARKLGFTAFCIDREKPEPDYNKWIITSLMQMADFEKAK